MEGASPFSPWLLAYPSSRVAAFFHPTLLLFQCLQSHLVSYPPTLISTNALYYFCSSAFGQSTDAAKRSINLALSQRGQSALSAVGVLDAVMSSTVPMPQRAIHAKGGALIPQAYGRPGEAIFSVSRGLVNSVLLDACDRAPGVALHFGVGLGSLDESGLLTLVDKGGGVPPHTPYRPRLVVGADGAFSKVREAMLRWSRASFSRTFIEHGYKELVMPATPSGDFPLPCPHALHIWPRTQFMLIALPNTDKSMTCTLFAPFDTFEGLDAEVASKGAGAALGGFFSTHFPDALPLLPTLSQDWVTNPTSSLVEVRCKPWQYKSRVLLIGDAAHSTVPFYGQGMNAALEDCLCLGEALDASLGGRDVEGAVAAFARDRQPAGEALCDLSMGNYDEMKAKTASPWFRARMALEGVLHSFFPTWWIPQYSMVAFTRIPYHEVIARAHRQDKALNRALGAVAASVGLAGGWLAWKALEKRRG
jgi:kynurenine 3-monooxygenase